MTDKSLKQKIYSVRLTQEQGAKIEEQAKAENRTVSNTVYNIVASYLAAKYPSLKQDSAGSEA